MNISSLRTVDSTNPRNIDVASLYNKRHIGLLSDDGAAAIAKG